MRWKLLAHTHSHTDTRARKLSSKNSIKSLSGTGTPMNEYHKQNQKYTRQVQGKRSKARGGAKRVQSIMGKGSLAQIECCRLSL